ncbi:MAG: hypothetical protein ACI4A5_00350 [Hominilimicola sp.]
MIMRTADIKLNVNFTAITAVMNFLYDSVYSDHHYETVFSIYARVKASEL